MKSVKGQTAFITGGASGIGLGIAKAFYAAGANVVLADIREDHMETATAHFNDPKRVMTIKLDVTDREQYREVVQSVIDKFGKVHMLFNNAGIGVGGPLKMLKFDDWDWGLSVMIGGVINGIQILLPHIMSHGEGGHIINTASKAALVPVSSFSIYGTAKSAMVGLSESIRSEMGDENIGVSVFCPGPVQSNIRETGRTRPKEFQKETGLMEVEKMLEERPNSPLWMSPEECGERVLKGVQNNDLYILTHPEFKAGTEARFKYIMNSFPDEPLNEARAKEISFLLTNPLYDEFL